MWHRQHSLKNLRRITNDIKERDLIVTLICIETLLLRYMLHLGAWSLRRGSFQNLAESDDRMREIFPSILWTQNKVRNFRFTSINAFD